MSSESRRKRLHGWWKQNAWMVGFGASYTVVIAVVSVIVEDVASVLGGGDGPLAWVWVVRLSILTGAGVGAAWLYTKARQDAQHHGTTYYVRLLDASMPDWNASAVRDQHKRDFRSASRTCDAAAPWQDRRYLNIVDDVEAVGAELECAMNSDTDDRGSQVIPNLIAPAGLALGYGWTVGDGATELVEVNRKGRELTADFRFDEASLQDFAVEQDATWREKGNPTFPYIDVGAIRHWDRRSECLAATEEPRRVWLTIKLTTGPGFGRVGTVDSRCPLRQGADLVRVVGGFGAWTPEVKAEQIPLLSLLPVKVPSGSKWPQFETPTERNGMVLADPQALAWATAAAIHRTLADFPKATVMLSMRVPKTVSVGAGLLLQGSNPWHRLVPVHFTPGHNLLVQARRDQCRPESLLTEGTTGPFENYLKAVKWPPPNASGQGAPSA